MNVQGKLNWCKVKETTDAISCSLRKRWQLKKRKVIKSILNDEMFFHVPVFCSSTSSPSFSSSLAYDRLVNEYEILRKAVLENNIKITERIINDLNIEKEIAVNFAPKEENSLLFLWVCYWSCVSRSDIHGQKINVICVDWYFRACQNGYIEQVDCLIIAGAKCIAHKITKCTPLYAAIRAGHIAIIKKLLTQFPDAIDVNYSHHTK